MTSTCIRYTAAPTDFDGFGTTTINGNAGKDGRGRTIREVEIALEHLEWQERRYGSGLFVSKETLEDF